MKLIFRSSNWKGLFVSSHKSTKTHFFTPTQGKSRVGVQILTLTQSPRVATLSSLCILCESGSFMLISSPGILLNLEQLVSTSQDSEKRQQRRTHPISLSTAPAAGCFQNGHSIHMQPQNKYLLSFCYFLGIVLVTEDSPTLTAHRAQIRRSTCKYRVLSASTEAMSSYKKGTYSVLGVYGGLLRKSAADF